MLHKLELLAPQSVRVLLLPLAGWMCRLADQASSLKPAAVCKQRIAPANTTVAAWQCNALAGGQRPHQARPGEVLDDNTRF